MLGKLAAMAIPPWAIILILGGIVGTIFGGGLWTGLKLGDGKLARCEIRVNTKQVMVTERDRQLVIRDESLAAIRKQLTDAEKARDVADSKYQAEVNKPPKTVTRWRTAATEVETAVQGENCVEFLGSAIDHVKASLGGGS